MKSVIGIQARMSSTRLPGKSLADLAGEPVIMRVVERARAARRVDEVVVLTSTDPSDDPLVEVLEARAVPVRRGPLDDVYARYLALVEEMEPDDAADVLGDLPGEQSARILELMEAEEAEEVRELLAAIVFSAALGAIVPLFFRAIGVDPAVASGPLITTLNDALSPGTYFGICATLLDLFPTGAF